MTDSGFVSWYFDIDDDGWYKLELGYCAFGGSKVQFIKINNKKTPYEFGYSTIWNEFTKPIRLEAGNNTLGWYPTGDSLTLII